MFATRSPLDVDSRHYLRSTMSGTGNTESKIFRSSDSQILKIGEHDVSIF